MASAMPKRVRLDCGFSRCGPFFSGAFDLLPRTCIHLNSQTPKSMIPQRNSDASAIVAASRTFFVTSSTADKRSLFQSTRLAELFIKVLLDYRDQRKFRLHEFVLMRDHFHLLLTIGPEMTVESAMQFIKGGFSFRAGRELDFHGAVWQRGFSEVRILDEASYRAHVEYIRDNPVRAHLADAPERYPYCSAFPGYILDPPPQGLKPSMINDASAARLKAVP
jgi:putative transposase